MQSTDLSLTAGRLAEILLSGNTRQLDAVVRVCVHAPGTVGGTPKVDVTSAQFGFDWDNGSFLLRPSVHLTTLTPEDVAAIRESVAKGNSWHAYQSYKKQRERIKELEAEVQSLKETLKIGFPFGVDAGAPGGDRTVEVTVHKVNGSLVKHSGCDHFGVPLSCGQPERTDCWCQACDIATSSLGLRTRMSLCPQCGDKRCPHAQHHDFKCQSEKPKESV